MLVSIGGGALISGVATALRSRRPEVRIWGVETEGAQAMSEALIAGGPVPVALSSIVSTLSAPTVSQLTYDHVAALVTDVLVVSDAEAVQGTFDLVNHAKVWAEPAAGCLLPAARRVIERVGAGARRPDQHEMAGDIHAIGLWEARRAGPPRRRGRSGAGPRSHRRPVVPPRRRPGWGWPRGGCRPRRGRRPGWLGAGTATSRGTRAINR